MGIRTPQRWHRKARNGIGTLTGAYHEEVVMRVVIAAAVVVVDIFLGRVVVCQVSSSKNVESKVKETKEMQAAHSDNQDWWNNKQSADAKAWTLPSSVLFQNKTKRNETKSQPAK